MYRCTRITQHIACDGNPIFVKFDRSQFSKIGSHLRNGNFILISQIVINNCKKSVVMISKWVKKLWLGSYFDSIFSLQRNLYNYRHNSKESTVKCILHLVFFFYLYPTKWNFYKTYTNLSYIVHLLFEILIQMNLEVKRCMLYLYQMGEWGYIKLTGVVESFSSF